METIKSSLSNPWIASGVAGAATYFGLVWLKPSFLYSGKSLRTDTQLCPLSVSAAAALVVIMYFTFTGKVRFEGAYRGAASPTLPASAFGSLTFGPQGFRSMTRGDLLPASNFSY